jgi:hypothetical protein
MVLSHRNKDDGFFSVRFARESTAHRESLSPEYDLPIHQSIHLQFGVRNAEEFPDRKYESCGTLDRHEERS